MIVDGIKYRCKDGGQDFFIPMATSPEEIEKERESYAEVLREDLRLHKMAISRNDQCFQLVDKEII